MPNNIQLQIIYTEKVGATSREAKLATDGSTQRQTIDLHVHY